MYVGGFDTPAQFEFDPYHQMMNALPYMVDKARLAALNDSASYRGFHVGAAVFAVNEANQSTGIFNGGNLKTKQTRDKVCAEKRAVVQAEKSGFLSVPGIVVVATTDRQKIAGVNLHNIETPTLPPCAECMDPSGPVAGSPLISAENTLVLTTGINEDIFQIRTLGELQRAFEERDEKKLKEARPHFSWEVAAAIYDSLAGYEKRLPPEERKVPAQLAKTALLSQIF